MHKVVIFLDEAEYAQVKRLAKEDDRSTRKYLKRLLLGALKSPTPTVTPTPGVIEKPKSKTYFDQEREIWRIRESVPCELCGVQVEPTMEYGGNPVAGWYHQACFDKENADE